MPTSKSSMLQLATQEKTKNFEVKKTWAELGGSSHAQQYLQNFDEHPTEFGVSSRRVTPKHRLMPGLSARNTWELSRIPATSRSVSTMSAQVEEKSAAEMTAEMLKF